MNLRLISLIGLILLVTFGNSLSINVVEKPQQFTNLSIEQAIDLISDAQNELIQKLVKHYLTDFLQKQDDLSKNKKIEKIYNLFQNNKLVSTTDKIQKFMRQKLFNKLEMPALHKSFLEEINNHPDEYFLTVEMYDLLID